MEGGQDCRNRFQGLARVAFTSIYHNSVTIPQYFNKKTPAESKQATALARDFEIRGCQRTNHHNFIDVIAQDRDLQGVSLASQSSTPLEEIPFLDLPVRCLHGLHRLLAACEVIQVEEDRWWIARVFQSDLAEGDATLVSEQFSNENSGHDGMIFRNIRLYHRKKDTDGENRWWARLTNRKRQDLKQLLKDERYCQVFDAMTEWPGLWFPVRLGCLQRLLTMKCDEELLEYLNHIVRTWRDILFGIDDDENMVDEATVLALETLVPGASSEDSIKVREAMQSGKAFAALKSHHSREIVLQNLLGVQGLIPSLHTFFESLKVLEPCAKIMRSIAPIRGHGSIRESLWSSYCKPLRMTIEYSEDDTRDHPSSSLPMDRTLAYQQLWLFTMRNFPRMNNTTVRKNKKGVKPITTEPDPSVWEAFGKLAWRLGFQTHRIGQLKNSNGALELAERMTRQAGLEDRSDLVKAIVSALRRRGLERQPPRQLQFFNLVSLSKDVRCGRPRVDDHALDCKGLFLPALLRPLPQDLLSNVTTFFCKRDMFLSFFGSSTVSVHFNAARPSPQPQEVDDEFEPTFSRDENAREDTTHAEQGKSTTGVSSRDTEVTELQDRLRAVSTENDDLRADLRDAREETFQINATSVVEKQNLQKRLGEEQARTQRLEKELEALRQPPSDKANHYQFQGTSSNTQHSAPLRSKAEWLAKFPKMNRTTRSELQDVITSGDLMLVVIDSHEAHRVQRYQVEEVLSYVSTGYRHYLGDFGALQSDIAGLHGLKAVAPSEDGNMQHVGELWKRLGVLAIHDDKVPAWTGVTNDSLRKQRDGESSVQPAGTKRKISDHASSVGGSPLPAAKRPAQIQSPKGKARKERGGKLFRNRNLFEPPR